MKKNWLKNTKDTLTERQERVLKAREKHKRMRSNTVDNDD